MRTNANVKLDFEVNFTLNETELRAMDALVGYGFESFIKVFYEKLGKAYMEPHVAGLEAMFQKVEALRPAIYEIDGIRKAAIEVKKKFNP